MGGERGGGWPERLGKGGWRSGAVGMFVVYGSHQGHGAMEAPSPCLAGTLMVRVAVGPASCPHPVHHMIPSHLPPRRGARGADRSGCQEGAGPGAGGKVPNARAALAGSAASLRAHGHGLDAACAAGLARRALVPQAVRGGGRLLFLLLRLQQLVLTLEEAGRLLKGVHTEGRALRLTLPLSADMTQPTVVLESIFLLLFNVLLPSVPCMLRANGCDTQYIVAGKGRGADPRVCAHRPGPLPPGHPTSLFAAGRGTGHLRKSLQLGEKTGLGPGVQGLG